MRIITSLIILVVSFLFSACSGKNNSPQDSARFLLSRAPDYQLALDCSGDNRFEGNYDRPL